MSDAASPRRARARDVLARRARNLARKEQDANTTTTRTSFLSFNLSGRGFAVPLAHVVRTAHIDHLTAIPCAPPHLLGLLNFDMNMVTLIDLVALLDLARHSGGDVTHAVVISAAERFVALASDHVWGIEEIPKADIVALPAEERPFDRVMSSRNQQIPVLDVHALLERLQ